MWSTSTSEGWAALAELVGPRGVAVFLRGEVEPAPRGWTELLREPATQYVAGDLAEPPGDGRAEEVAELTASDVPDMVRLAAETEPGPFGPNSHLTGRWFGIRRRGGSSRWRASGCGSRGSARCPGCASTRRPAARGWARW